MSHPQSPAAGPAPRMWGWDVKADEKGTKAGGRERHITGWFVCMRQETMESLMRRPVSRLMFSSWLSQHVVNNKKDQRSSMGVKQAWQGIKYGRAISFPLERSKQRWWGRWVCFQPYKVRSPIDSGFRRSEERSSRQDPLYNRTYEFVCFAIGE